MYWNLTDKERLLTAFEIAGESKLLEKFVVDFFTKKEIENFEVRLRTFCMLRDRATYTQISSTTGLSPNTIAKLSKITSYHENGIDPILRKFLKKGGSKNAYFD